MLENINTIDFRVEKGKKIIGTILLNLYAIKYSFGSEVTKAGRKWICCSI